MQRLAARVTPGWRTRFAPAPTGWLHLGHALNAIHVWGLSRYLGGQVLLRIEDHDRSRCRPEFEQGILDDLDWLGLVPDIGSTDEFRRGTTQLRQSDAGGRYDAALALLAARGPASVYRCTCSRRQVAALTGDVPGVESPYPGTCRASGHPPSSTPATRVVMASGVEPFDDPLFGTFNDDPSLQCGDLLVRDRRGNWTYQFAVVVDDIEQGIDLVIRGEDLLSSTARQIRLARLLGRERPPVFAHHPVLTHPDGTKLSKSAGDTGIAELRAAGWSAARTLGEAAYRAGLQREPGSIEAKDLANLFAALQA